MKFTNSFWVISLCLLFASQGNTQCSAIPTALFERTLLSELIVEGKVISQQSFWDEGHKLIYTANRIEVYKQFKGERLNASFVDLITLGGIVDLEAVMVTPSLSLRMGDVGVFLLSEKTIQPELNAGVRLENNAFLSSYGEQSFLKYNLVNGKVFDYTEPFDDIKNRLYPTLEIYAHQEFIAVGAFDIDNYYRSNQGQARAAAISSFMPASLNAGRGEVLTINGSGFGAVQGSGVVTFTSSGSPGVSITVQPLASQYVSWSDTQIQVEVPSLAATGPFRVTASDASTAISATLTVGYAFINVSNAGIDFDTHFIDADGAGGYTFTYNVGLAATMATTPFETAFTNWCATTGVNWRINSSTSAIDAIDSGDGVNIIRFAPDGEFSGAVIGQAFISYSGCFAGADVVWSAVALDMRFRASTNWHFGAGAPGPTEVDFETVALHELGHHHGMGHIRESLSTVMHPQVITGTTRRIINPANEAIGGFAFIGLSTVAPACGGPEMATGVDCSAIILPIDLANFNAYENGVNNEVKWSTYAEQNVKWHIIERSPTGAAPFYEVGRILGAEESSKEITYKLIDDQPLSQAFYRLRTVDFDGNEELFAPVFLKRKQPTPRSITIYPNPVKDDFNLSIDNPGRLTASFRIFNEIGQEVLVSELSNGESFIKKTISLQSLAAGLYWLEIKLENEYYFEKLVHY